MHYSVLLSESIALLQVKAGGVYIDGTFGRGGHSAAILAKLGPHGRLIAFDKDPDAISYAEQWVVDKRFTLIHDSFARLEVRLAELGIQEVDGVLFDLGVSSPQLDTPDRGFSFRFAAPLDMRMNNTVGDSAASWLATASEAELAEVFWRYGEEKFSRRIARAIVTQRAEHALLTTTDLAELVSRQIPYREKGQHPATRVFQAIRIKINDELSDLEAALVRVPKLLKIGGRMVVISFHSLEDRIVKTKFAEYATADCLPRWVMLSEIRPEYKIIAKKIKAASAEVAENSRSRSAIMRGLERVYVKDN